MDELTVFFDGVAAFWRSLPPGSIERNLVAGIAMGLCFLLIVGAIERTSGARTDIYRSRVFLHDVAYWFYYRSGLQRILFTGAIFAALELPLSHLEMKLLTPLPYALQVVLYILIGEFIAYWIHRSQHRYRFLWVFHTTHHSQERLNFATSARFHPVDNMIRSTLIYVVLRILGANPLVWLPVVLASELTSALNHSRIAWRYGPFYRILVSPVFHSFHHSTDPAHHDKNFSDGFFCIWDHMFGTAVKHDASRPIRFGLESVRPTSLWSTFAAPFRLLYDDYRGSQANRRATSKQ